MFNPLKVKTIKKETKDAVSIEFEVPENLQNEYTFKAGQFLTLKSTINDAEVRRSYSIYSTPKSGNLKVAVKQIPNGVYSTFANNYIKEGDFIEVAKPSGNFYVETKSNNQKHYVLIAAGSGITPVFSVLKTILVEEPTSKITLFYGNKNQENTIFFSELVETQKTFGNRLEIHFIYSQAKGEDRFHTGRIEGRKIKKIFKKYAPVTAVDEVFICGPQQMTESVKSILQEKFNFPAHQIHFELFSTTQVVEKTNEKSSKSGLSTVKATLDGNLIEFTVNPDESILDAGLRQGYDLPYSCQGGVCGACKCVKGEGELEMDVCIALSDEEVESGQYLACQSKVKSKSAIISFDY